MTEQWSIRRLTILLYPLGAGVMAVNLFFASLIGSWIGLAVMHPLTAVSVGLVLGWPATYWFAQHIKKLMGE